MGWCRDFGAQIEAGCHHPMEAGQSSCSCPQCGVVCHGQFDACSEVWARGPLPVALIDQPHDLLALGHDLAHTDDDLGGAIVHGPARDGSLGREPRRAEPRADEPRRREPTRERPGPGPGRNGDASGGQPDGARRAPNGNHPGEPGRPPSEAYRRFERAMRDLREEVQSLRSLVALQQAVLTEILESQRASKRDGDISGLVNRAVEEVLSTRLDLIDRSLAHGLDEVGRRIDRLAGGQGEPQLGPIATLVRAKAAATGRTATGGSADVKPAGR